LTLNSKIVKIVLLIVTLVYCYFETKYHQDFDIFILATQDFLSGGNIYVNTYDNGFHFFYGAIFSVLLAPLSFLPIYVARFVWIVLNIFALFKTWKLITDYLEKRDFSAKQILWFNAFCFIFSAKLVLDNFHNGQVTIFLLLIMLQGLKLINQNKNSAGACLIALGISIKLLPLIIIPYLFFNKQFKAVALIIVFFILFLVLPSLIVGFEQNNKLLIEWWHLINPTTTANVIDTGEPGLNGLTTLIPTLFMADVPSNAECILKRNILNLNPQTIGSIINGIRLILVVFTVYFLRRLPFKKAKTKLQSTWELSYILLLIPMIFPHQQHYAFLLALPAVIYCIYWLFVQRSIISKHKFYLRFILLSIIYICFNLHLLLGEFREYYDHFKIISYGSILLVLVLAMCKPNAKMLIGDMDRV